MTFLVRSFIRSFVLLHCSSVVSCERRPLLMYRVLRYFDMVCFALLSFCAFLRLLPSAFRSRLAISLYPIYIYPTPVYICPILRSVSFIPYFGVYIYPLSHYPMYPMSISQTRYVSQTRIPTPYYYPMCRISIYPFYPLSHISHTSYIPCPIYPVSHTLSYPIYSGGYDLRERTIQDQERSTIAGDL